MLIVSTKEYTNHSECCRAAIEISNYSNTYVSPRKIEEGLWTLDSRYDISSKPLTHPLSGAH